MEKRRPGRPRISRPDQNFEFFQVYISERCSNHLEIPPDFIKHFNGRPPKQMTLKNLTGQSWELDMEKDKDGTFFKNGWPDFVKDNSLVEGEFLVFRYNGRSGLTVRIFGLDGCKKEEHVKNEATSETENEADLAHNRNNLGKRGRRPTERSRNVACGSKPNTCKSSHLNFGEESKGIMANEAEKERALQSARAFRSKNPFFTAVIKPGFMKCNVTIPRAFAYRYVNKKKEDRVEVTLIVLGRSWPISCLRKDVMMLTGGWTAFARDNCLQVGDVCVFELIEGSEISLNVIIFRAGKSVNC